MISLIILFILISVATPSFQQMTYNAKLRSVANHLSLSIYLARSEAAKRGFPVTLCASNIDQTACDEDAPDYSQGWIVFTDYDNDRRVTAPSVLFDTTGDGNLDSPETILYVSNPLDGSFLIQSNRAAARRSLTYYPNGLSSARILSIYIRDAEDQANRYRIAFNITGRSRGCYIRPQSVC